MKTKIAPNAKIAKLYEEAQKEELKREYIAAYERSGEKVTDDLIAEFDRLAYQNTKNAYKIIEQISNKDMIIKNDKDFTKQYSKAPEYADSTRSQKKLFELLEQNNFFKVITGKTQSGSELIRKTQGRVNGIKDISDSVNISPVARQQISDPQLTKQALDKYNDIMTNGGHIASFDYETIGGVNSYGHQQLNVITEVSGSIYEVEKGKNPFEKVGKKFTSEVADMTTVLGLSEEDHKQFISNLQEMRKRGHTASGYDQVLLKRGMVYGDAATVYGKADGFVHQILKGANSSEIKINNFNEAIETAIKGFDKLREIGREQEKWVAGNTKFNNLKDYQADYIKQFKSLMYEGKVGGTKQYKNLVTLAYNGINFDELATNVIAGTNRGDFRKTTLDPYQMLMYAESVLGDNAMLPKGAQMDRRFGKGTLEAFSNLVGAAGTDAEAHIAKFDQMMTFQTFSNNHDLLKHFTDTFYKAYDQESSKYGKGIKGKTFLTNKGIQMSLSNEKAFGFAYDPLSEQMKSISGVSLRPDGTTVDNFKEFGPKTNMLVNHEVSQMSLNKSWKDMFKQAYKNNEISSELYQEFMEAKELFMLKTTERIDQGMAERDFGKDNVYKRGKEYYTFFTDKHKIPAMLGEEIMDENGAMSEAAKGTKFYIDKANGDGTFGYQTLEAGKDAQTDALILESLNKRTYNARVNDSAMRTVREHKSKSTLRIKQFMDDESKSISQFIAEQVSKNQTVTGAPLTTLLKDKKPFSDSVYGKNPLLPETIRKNNSLGKYVNDNFGFFGAIQDGFENTGALSITDDMSDYAKKATWNKRDYAMRQIYEDLAGKYLENEEVMNEWQKLKATSTPRILTEKEMNKIQVATKYVNPTKHENSMISAMGLKSKQYETLDLSNSNQFFKKFFNANYAGDKFDMSGNEGFHALVKAYDTFETMPEFEGVWRGFDRKKLMSYQGGNHKQLAGDMLSTIKSYTERRRKKDFSFGRKYSMDDVDPTSTEFLQAVKKVVGIEGMASDIKDSLHNLPNIKIFNNAAENHAVTNDMIDKIVKGYIMNIDEKQFEEDLLGYEEHQQRALRYKRELVEIDAKKQAEEIVKAAGKTNGSLAIIGEGDKAVLGLIENGEFTDIGAYRHKAKKGIVTTQVGNQEYATRFAFDVGNVRKSTGVKENFKLSDIKLSTNMANSRNISNLSYSVHRNMNAGLSGGEAMLEAFKYQNKNLRNQEVRLDKIVDFNTYAFSNAVDTSSLSSIFPEISKDLYDHAEKMYAGTGFINENDRKLYKEMTRRLTEQANDGKRAMSSAEMMPHEGILFKIKYQDALLDMLKNNIGEDGVSKFIIENITNKNKDTNFITDHMGLFADYVDPLAKVDDGSRPPVSQKGSSVFYDKEKIEEQLRRGRNNKFAKELFSDEYTSTESSITSKLKDKFLHNSNGKYTSAITATQLTIDSDNLKNIFINELDDGGQKYKDFIKKKFGHKGEDWLKANEKTLVDKLHQKALSMSTYEQQGIMHSRIADLAFHETNIKRYNAKQEILYSSLNNVDQIETMKSVNKLDFKLDADGNVRYQVGRHVERNDFLFEMVQGKNNTQKHYAKDDGILRMIYTDDNGKKISEERLNEALKDFKGDKTNKQAVADYLEERFDKTYEFIGMNEKYGSKVFSGPSEKGTAHVLRGRVGEYDETIGADLEKYAASLSDPDEQRVVRNLKGKHLEKNYRDEVLKDLFSRNSEGKALYSRILDEQHTFSDFLSEFEEFKGVGYISNMNVKKHQSVSAGMADVFEKMSRADILNETNMKAMLMGEDAFSINTMKLTGRKQVSLNDQGWDGLVLDKDQWIERGMSVEDADRVQRMMDSQDWVSLNGNKVGYKSYVELAHVKDEYAGTLRGDDSYYADITKLKEDAQYQLEKVSANLAKAEKLGPDSMPPELYAKYLEEKDTFNKLTGSIAQIDSELNAWDKSKGLKYSERMNTNLQRTVYSEDRMQLAKENMIEGYQKSGMTLEAATKAAEEDFGSTFGKYANFDGTVKEGYLGKKILEPITDALQDELLISKGSRLVQDSSNKKLKKFFNKNFRGNITEDRAELLYSQHMGNKALAFNEFGDGNSSKANALIEGKRGWDKFNLVDLSATGNGMDRVQFDLGGQGEHITNLDNNPYTNNLMVKTGLGGKYEYVALGQMPEKHFKDSLSGAEHVNMFKSIQQNIVASQNMSISDTDRDKYIADAKKGIDRLVEQQKKDLNSKSGLMGKITEKRLDQSMFGRGSGLTINTFDKNGKSFRPQGEGSNSLTYYENLQKHNARFLDKAMIDGKSILEHYSQGKVYDTVFASEEMFNKMGYFDEDFMAGIFDAEGSKYKGDTKFASHSARVDEMKNLLRTQGDSFISTRFPEIMEGSDKMARVFLNDDLRGNQLLATGAAGMSMKLDHDGDQFAVARVKTKDGLSYIHKAVGVGADNEQLQNMQSAIDVSMKSRALVENRYWEQRVYDKVGGEKQVALMGARIEEIAKNNIVGGKLRVAEAPSSNMSYAQHQANKAKYQDVLDEARKTWTQMDSAEVASKGYKNMHNIAEEIIQRETNAGVKGLNLEDYHRAAGFEIYQNETIAKVFKSGVGQANVTNYKMKHMATELLDTTKSNYDYQVNLVHQFFYQSEEAAISAKSSVEGLTADRAKQYNEWMKDIMKTSDTAIHESRRAKLVDWGHQYLKPAIDWDGQYQSSKGFQDMAHKVLEVDSYEAFQTAMKDSSNVNKIFNKTMNDLVDITVGFGKMDGAYEAFDYLSVATSSTGASSKKAMNPVLAKGSKSINAKVAQAFSNVNALDEDLMRARRQLDKISTGKSNFDTVYGDSVYKSLDNSVSSRGAVSDIIEATTDMFKSVGKSNLALGALGVAAAVMTAGFVGGKPQPTQQQAQELAEDHPEAPQGAGNMMLSDAGNQHQTPIGGGRGYVVNINARSNRGRDNAAQAIQQALTKSVGSNNVNIQMSVNEDYGNVSDRDMKDAIWSAF